MRFWTLIKLLAAVCVLAVVGFTALLSYHVMVKPLGGIFSKIIPNPTETASKRQDADFVKMLDSADLPDIDPGEKAFQKTHELLALGQLAEAREKLGYIVTTYPSSSSAPLARSILSQMNLDELLSAAHLTGKKTHLVKRGNSYLGIAAEYHTTLDMIMQLNGMFELKNIQPGDELIVMPLEFRLLIEPQRKTLSLWDGSTFLCEYSILNRGVTGKLAAGKTKVGAKLAELAGRQIPVQSKDYRAAAKVIQLAKPALQIRGSDPAGDTTAAHGIVLRSEDMEELNLLLRAGNDVEIR